MGHNKGAKGWMRDVLKICNRSEIQALTELKFVYDLDPVQRKFLRQCREEQRYAVEKTQKLRTYKELKDCTEYFGEV